LEPEKEQNPLPKLPVRRWVAVVRRLLRSIGLAKLALLLLVGAVLLGLQYPWVQTRLANYATGWLVGKTGFAITIDKVSIRWLDAAVLKGVQVLDRQGQPMIVAEEIGVDYDLLALLQGKDIVLDRARLYHTDVNLINNEPDSSLNIDAFIKALSGPPSQDTTPSTQQFIIGQASLEDVRFSMHKPYADSLPAEMFDYNHFTLEKLNGDVEDFRVMNDTIQLLAVKLSGQEAHLKLPIHELSTFFRYWHTGMMFDDLRLRLGQSVLGDSLVFRFNGPEDFSDFNHKITIHAKLNGTEVSTDDLAVFAPGLRAYGDRYRVSATLRGTVERLQVRNANLGFGRESRLVGNFAFDGLPNLDETLLQFKFRDADVQVADLRPYVGEGPSEFLAKFGRLRFSGEFDGLPYDFVTKAKIQTDLGYLAPDLNIKVNEEFYEGTLVTKGLDLGRLLDQPLLQLLDMQAKVERGRGFDLKTADLKMTANIARLGVRGYGYQNLEFNGLVQQGVIDGGLNIADPNLTFSGAGKVDLNSQTIEAEANVAKALLQPLGFTKVESSLRADVDLNFTGLTLDELQGDLDFDSLYLAYGAKDVLFKPLKIHSSIEAGQQRDFYVQSDMLDIEAVGNFKPSRTLRDIGLLYEEYMLDLVNDSAAIWQYYHDPARLKKRVDDWKATGYEMDYSIVLKNINPIAQVFAPDLYVSKGATLKGYFRRDSLSNFFVQSQRLDTLSYGRYWFRQNDFTYLTTKQPQRDSIFASLRFVSQAPALKNPDGSSALELEGLRLESLWRGQEIGYQFFVKQKDQPDYADLKGSFRLLANNRYQFNLYPSHLKVLNEDWANTDTARVDVRGREVKFANFYAAYGKRFLQVAGQLSEDPAQPLNLQLANFNLGVFSKLLGKKLTGYASLDATVQDAYRDLRVDGNLGADSITIDGFLIGDLASKVAWSKEKRGLSIDADIQRQGFKVIEVGGFYEPEARVPLNLTAELKEAEVNMIEPFLSDLASNFTGKAEGKVRIRGQLDEIGVKGELFVRGGGLTVNYLGTRYFFDDRIYFDEDYIGMRNLRLRDDRNAPAFIDGGIYHSGFDNFLLQITGTYKKFKVLDTKFSEESLYYGTAVGTGDFSIFGPTDRLAIKVNTRSEEGTRLSLPLDGYASAQSQEFVRFTSFRPADSAQAALPGQAVAKLDLSTLTVDMNLDITPDAYFEIIFDKKSGDIIRGNAKGKMNLDVNTRGDFTMVGDVEIVKGAYNFTFQNLFNKEFAIDPGSRLTWSGDPYKGQVNVTAVYDQRVAYKPIFSNALPVELQNAAEANRRYPTRVNLNVTGDILAPNIKFGLDFYDYPRTIVVGSQQINLETELSAFRARLDADEQELNRQVFSLILLKRLATAGDFRGLNAGQSAGGSVSELFANQISNWLSQVDEKLEVDINLNGLDANALNTMQLRLSYSFLNGRVRITRDGAFTSVNNQANASTIAGDWTVEYLISPDGRMRMKVYRRNIANTFNAALGGNTTTGMSFQFTKSFATISELFGQRRRGKAPARQNRRSQALPPRNRDSEIVF
jgi:hypothetical protein